MASPSVLEVVLSWPIEDEGIGFRYVFHRRTVRNEDRGAHWNRTATGDRRTLARAPPQQHFALRLQPQRFAEVLVHLSAGSGDVRSLEDAAGQFCCLLESAVAIGPSIQRLVLALLQPKHRVDGAARRLFLTRDGADDRAHHVLGDAQIADESRIEVLRPFHRRERATELEVDEPRQHRIVGRLPVQDPLALNVDLAQQVGEQLAAGAQTLDLGGRILLNVVEEVPGTRP